MHICNLGLAHTANGGTLYLLLMLGCFGDPASDLKARLNDAFDDFRQWCKSHRPRIVCSQRRFKLHHLIKKSNGAYLTSKAHNARVLVQWLAHCAEVATSGVWPQHRILGRWIQESGGSLPADPRLVPTAVAMILV